MYIYLQKIFLLQKLIVVGNPILWCNIHVEPRKYFKIRLLGDALSEFLPPPRMLCFCLGLPVCLSVCLFVCLFVCL